MKLLRVFCGLNDETPLFNAYAEIYTQDIKRSKLWWMSHESKDGVRYWGNNSVLLSHEYAVRCSIYEEQNELFEDQNLLAVRPVYMHKCEKQISII